jgi:predicted N-acetyltransferase YhbS
MKVRLGKYKPEQDFVRIRDFLVETYRAFEGIYNWRLERWNYARYFVAPFLGTYGQEEPDLEDSLKAIRFWEDAIRVWENDAGEIVGVVNIEAPVAWHPEFGEAFFQRHPQYDFLLDEMLDYAEETFADEKRPAHTIHIYEYDEPLQALAHERGYRRDAEHPHHDSEFIIRGELPTLKLPEGYVLQSMAQENNIELRREIFGRAFDHPDPSEWPSAFSYEELQKAPDYRKDLDLYIIGPDGKYVSCCIIWYDGHNRMGMLEPVGTHPDYRRQGFGGEVVMEGIRRAAALGAEKVYVGSGQPFYEAIGFQKKYVSYRWTKEF